MSEIMKVDTVQQYNDYFGVETLHPLVSVIEGSKGKPLRFGKKLYNIYAILLKDANCGNLKYGKIRLSAGDDAFPRPRSGNGI